MFYLWLGLPVNQSNQFQRAGCCLFSDRSMSSPTRRSNSLGLWHVQLKHGLLPLTKPEVYSPGLKRRVPFFQLAVRCFGKRERPQETTALFFLHRLKNGSVSLHLALALPLSPSLPHSISFSLYIYVDIYIYTHTQVYGNHQQSNCWCCSCWANFDAIWVHVFDFTKS